MSVKVMGAVWDLKIDRDQKFILLAYADHASHDGISIYPAISTIAEKTGYSERSVQAITRDLENNGYLVSDGQGPKGTNRWRIPISGGAIIGGANSAPVQKTAEGGANSAPRGVQKTAEGGAENAPGGVQWAAPESSLEPSINRDDRKMKLPEGSGMDWLMAAGADSSELAKVAEKERHEKAISDLWEIGMGYNPLPWHTDKDLKTLLRFLLDKNPDDIKAFCKWVRRPFTSFGPEKAREKPQRVIEFWPQAFTKLEDNSKEHLL